MKRLKKPLLLLLVAAILANLVPVISIAATDGRGEGFLSLVEHKTTVPAGYTPIYNREDLQKVRENLAGNYILMNDIDLYYEAWTPIGLSVSSSLPTEEGVFSGVFDGNGYEIRSMDVSVSDTSSAYIFVGLFGVVSGEVKNLSVSGTALAVSSQNVWAGGIAGYVTDSGKLTNCVGRVDVTASGASAYAGGIAGELLGSAAYLMNYGAVSAANAGGIVAVARDASLYECRNLGEVNANTGENATAGGIAATTIGGTEVIASSNVGEVTANSTNGLYAYAGGIVGNIGAGDGLIDKCWNSGRIYGSAYIVKLACESVACVGGIIGFADSGAMVQRSYNVGIIEGSVRNNDDVPRSSYAYQVVCILGGIVGRSWNIQINECFNGGVLKGTATCGDSFHTTSEVQCGGIIGRSQPLETGLISIKNVYNTGTMSGTSKGGNYNNVYQGGVLGTTSMSSQTAMISSSNCYWLSTTASSSIGYKSGSVTETRVSSLTDEQMKNQESFEGFPFGYTWTMGGDAEYEYPELVDLTYRTTNDICSHDAYGAWTETKPATCRENGEEMCECSICGSRRYRVTDKLAHTWGAWIDEKAEGCEAHSKHTRTCSVCGEVEVNTSSSSLTDWIVGKEATHTESGYRYKSCTNCNTCMIEEEIPALGHSYTENVVAPTCEERGYTEMTCSCGDSYRFDYTKPTGHTWSSWELYQKGPEYEPVGRRVCSTCQATEEILDMPTVITESANAKAGGIARVAISLENTKELAGLQLSVAYDENLTLSSVIVSDNASILFEGTVFEYKILDGEVILTWVSTDGGNVQYNGVIAYLEFSTVDSLSTGNYPVKIQTIEAVNEKKEDVGYCSADGYVRVVDYIPGDINGDLATNMKDVVLLMQYVAKWDVSVNEVALDVNADGSVNMKDVVLLMQYVAKWDVIIY